MSTPCLPALPGLISILLLACALPGEPLAADLGAATPDAASNSAQFDALDRIVVSATLSETAVAALPGAISVVERDQIQRELSQNLRDLVRYLPGVSVRSSFGRFGLGDFRIRGLEGNRVLIETDGIAVSDSFSIGSFSNANRMFIDPATLKSAEILRGPGSSLYGSDALGGVVSFRTLEPQDLIEDGSGRAGELRMGVGGEDRSRFGGGTAAFIGPRWSGLAVVHQREGEAPRNQGRNVSQGASRTAPNPQQTEQRSLLAKLGLGVSPEQAWTLTVEGNESLATTEVLSSRGLLRGFGAPVQVLDLRGDDQQTRARLSLRQRIEGLHWPLADLLTWQLYRQDSETTQRSIEERVSGVGTPSPSATRREREFNFDQRVEGVELTAHRQLKVSSWNHRLSWGLDWSQSTIRQKRDGRSIHLASGAVSNSLLPDVFPVRDFPLSRSRTAALYLQDELQTADSRWRLIPGVRIDRYALKPRLDPIFAADNPGIEPKPLSANSVSPKFGLVRRLDEHYSLFAGYARGFRSPPYNDVNLGFTNLQFGYTAKPNPDLKPETSDGFEWGLRRRDHGLWWSASAYLNRYRDFIDSLRSLGVDPASGLLVFQSQNVARARIYGLEIEGGIGLERWHPALDRFELRYAAAYARGKDTRADQPLPSVDPLNGVLGLRFAGARADVELVMRAAAGKRGAGEVATAHGAQAAFAPPGYAVFDLLLGLPLAPNLQLDIGVFNLADRHYWSWAAVPQQAASSDVLDRYSAAGRHASAQVELRF